MWEEERKWNEHTKEQVIFTFSPARASAGQASQCAQSFLAARPVCTSGQCKASGRGPVTLDHHHSFQS